MVTGPLFLFETNFSDIKKKKYEKHLFKTNMLFDLKIVDTYFLQWYYSFMHNIIL